MTRATIEIAVRVESAAWRRRVPQVARLARRAAAAALGATAGPLELAIVFADDDAVRALNRTWRGKDAPTNVLSFPAGATTPAGARLLGDVVLAFGTCAREAKAQGKTLAAHASHLVVHGVLHLLGHDHEDDRAAERMEAVERGILARLGIADPYASPARRRRAA